jgi:hypothetical protein
MIEGTGSLTNGIGSGRPKTYGSYGSGSGSATLIIAQLQDQLDGKGTESKEPVGGVWYWTVKVQ